MGKTITQTHTIHDCVNAPESSIPCIYHRTGAWDGCRLVFCLDCGQDLYRECEREIAS